MKKRFTDCDRFDDPWFRKMPMEYKALWEFITAKCDNAGVWKVDFELAAFMVGDSSIDEETAIKVFNSCKQRINPFKKGYWHIIDFVDFQFGGKDGENNFHKQIRSLYLSHGLSYFEGQTSHCQGALEKEEEKEIEQEKEKEKEKKKKFGEFVFLTEGEYSKLVQRFGQAETEAKISHLENAIGSKGYKYKSHYHTILNWAGRDGEKSGNRGIRGAKDLLETAEKIRQELNA